VRGVRAGPVGAGRDLRPDLRAGRGVGRPLAGQVDLHDGDDRDREHPEQRDVAVLDEIGRGTSTYDGVAIAWAVTEHIAEKIRARTLFATHYHELTDLAERVLPVTNLNVAVREWGEEVIFLRKIREGGTDRSYGIHVARIAGVPAEVVAEARRILTRLEGGSRAHTPSQHISGQQLTLFSPSLHPVLLELRHLDLEGMTPLQALRKLAEWREGLAVD
jgi:DNA mismatch repair protein MutS